MSNRGIKVLEYETGRKFRWTVGSGVVPAFLAAAGVGFVTPRRLPAQTRLAPDGALDGLLADNKRFTSGRLTAHEEDLSILKQNTAEKQEPFAAVPSPIIRANWASGNKWVVRIGAAAARTMRIGKQPVNVQAGMFYNAVRPDQIPFPHWSARLQIALL